MRRLSQCPCCDSPIENTIPVVLAPFLRERALKSSGPTGALAICTRCGFRCFVDRYEPDEIAAIYSGYRDTEYFEQRHRHEPWYTRAINDGIGGPDEVSRRNRRLRDFLLSRGILPGARSVLDWGGDQGQFIPEDFAERYVYDISGIATVPGVTAVSSNQLCDRRYDLVLLAHVLEHASDPVALLQEVLEVKAGYLYVEVPYEPVSLRSSFANTSYSKWVTKVATSSMYRPVTLASLASRRLLAKLPPLGVIQQHEHLNFFDETNLVRLIERVGCRVVGTVAFRKKGASGPVEAIGALAERPSDIAPRS